MRIAINQALLSRSEGEYPVGALIIKKGKIVSQSGPSVEKEKDPTSHAEVNVIKDACKKLNSKHLKGCILYSTHEPCSMCTGAIIWARIDQIVYGITISDLNKKRDSEGLRRVMKISASKIISEGEPKVKIIRSFLRKECLDLL